MAEKNKKVNLKIKKVFLSGTFALAFLVSQTAYAADVFFNPSSGTYKKDVTFSVNVIVSSPDQAMNAVSSTVTFPTDKMQVVSVSKNGSIVDFWAQEPSYSNTSGTVKFEGVVLTPGYQGNLGKILTINFKGKALGTGSLKFSGTTVYANDGFGTGILKAVSGASFQFIESGAAPEVIEVEKLPQATKEPEEVCEPDSIIYSTTHPGTIWRKENTAVFSWNVDDDIVASRIAFDHNPETLPTVISTPAIVEKKYENLSDGVWYFHLSLQNNDGWSKPEHFKIKIDSTAPEIKLAEVPRTDLTDPKPVISLKIFDQMSCLKNFTVNIDGAPVDFNKLPNGNLELETIEPGDHELSVIAYDRAGNQNEAYLDIRIKPLPEPIVKEYPSQVDRGIELVVRGESQKNVNITAKITNKRSSFLAREDFQSGSGKWTWTPDSHLKSGNYFISFKITDTRGASSNWSEPIGVRVGARANIDIAGFIRSIPPEVAMFGLIVIGILLIVFLTRALTLRSIRRHHQDWE